MKTASIIPDKQLLVIRFAYEPDVVAKVKTLSGRRWNPESKSWTAPVTRSSVKELQQWGFELSLGIQQWLKDQKLKPVSEIKAEHFHELFPYQQEGVQFLESRRGRTLLADEMGLGKSAQSLVWLDAHPEARPAGIVCPASLKFNWAEREARMWMKPETKISILKGKNGKTLPQADVYIVNYDILSGWVEELKKLKLQVVIVDECFVAGTRIETPDGSKPIEQIAVGDVVLNAIGTGVVQGVSKREVPQLLSLHLSNGSKIQCTPNHPIFTDEGWIRAVSCQGRTVFTSSDIFSIMSQASILNMEEHNEKTQDSELPAVSRNFSTSLCSEILLQEMHGNIQQPTPRGKEKDQRQINQASSGSSMCLVSKSSAAEARRSSIQTFLWEILLSEMEDVSARDQATNSLISKDDSRSTIDKNETITSASARISPAIIRAYEEKQSLYQTRGLCQNQTALEAIRAPIKSATITWRQRSTIAEASEDSLGCFRSRVEGRISNSNQAKNRIGVSHLLQSGFSITRSEDMDRAGWMETSAQRNPDTRSEESKSFDGIRVERVEVLESSGRGGAKTNTVYNLEVSGHPSYFADGILVHNCHMVKSTKALRTKAIKNLCQGVPHVLMLSGTPIVNRPAEMFNALNILAPATFPSFTKFAFRYCGARHNGFGWDFSGATHTEELHKLLTETVMIRRLKADVLKDLPDKLYSVLPMEIDNRKEYDAAANDLAAWLRENGEKTKAESASRAEALVKVEVLKQLAAKGKMAQVIEWIEDFLEQDQKLVVFAVHRAVVDALMERFKDVAVKVDGSVSGEDRQKAVDQFQTDDSVRLFVGNVKAAGVGITLTAASNVAFLEYTFSPGDHLQAEDRCHRIGQKNAVNIWYLVAQNTIDENLVRLLNQKQKVLDAVLEGKSSDGTTVFESLLIELKAN